MRVSGRGQSKPPETSDTDDTLNDDCFVRKWFALPQEHVVAGITKKALTTPPVGLFANQTVAQGIESLHARSAANRQCDRNHRTANQEVTHRNKSTQRNGAMPREFNRLPSGG
jgi:hypothetical protein